MWANLYLGEVPSLTAKNVEKKDRHSMGCTLCHLGILVSLAMNTSFLYIYICVNNSLFIVRITSNYTTLNQFT